MGLDEYELREWVRRVAHGEASRRHFLRTMLGLGLSGSLLAEMPSLENGGRAPDGTWTLWRLKQGVVWHDGHPFTADDVVFTWEFATDPATAATSSVAYENIHRIDKLNDHTVKVVFKEPTPLGLTDGGVPILPRHRFAEYKGANARNAPYNLKPVGTGPYKVVDFKPGDVAQKANNWAGQNVVRWSNAEYDRLWKAATTELDPVKCAALFIRMNDLVIEDVVVIPVVLRHDVSAVSHSLRGLELGPWDLNLWNLAYWYRET